MGSKTRTLAVALAALTATSQVEAQVAPVSRTITLTFTGVVSSSAADTILIRQPDGSYSSYTGPLPDIGYNKGEPVSISFNATVPTKAFYDSGTYQGQIAADGIYRITLVSPPYSGGGGPGGIGNSSVADVSGAISPALNSGQTTNTRMTLVYDYNADSFSIEGGSFASGAYAGPGYLYDAASGSYQPCSGTALGGCRGVATSDPVLFGLSGSADGTVVSTSRIGIQSTDPTSPTGIGSFLLSFLGSWNLPQFRPGGSTEVPEPGMLVMFGAASLFVARRRRRRPARSDATAAI